MACLALAEKSGIGRVVAHSRDFPPEGVWNNHPCCVLVASKDLLQNHPDMVMAASAILLSGVDYAPEHPEDLPETTADWLMGDRDYLLGRNENRLSFYIKQFIKIDLLIIDELWYVTLDLTAVELLFQLLKRISLKLGGCKRYYISSALT